MPAEYPILSYSLSIARPVKAELWMVYNLNRRCLRLDTWKRGKTMDESLYAYEDSNYCGYQGTQTPSLHFVENASQNGQLDLVSFKQPLEMLLNRLATRQTIYFPFVSHEIPRLQKLGGARSPSLWLHRLILRQFPFGCLKNLCQVTGLDIRKLPDNLRKHVIIEAI
jgi:hypothetical protein